MYTKAYKIYKKLEMLNVSTSAGKGIYSTKNIQGNTIYIGVAPYSANISVTFGRIATSASAEGTNFSDDPVAFVDDGTVYTYNFPQSIVTKVLSSDYTDSTASKAIAKVRYSVVNNGTSDVTLYKLFSRCGTHASSSFLGDVGTINTIILCYVQELPTPVTIEAGGTAVIDVQLELDLT